MNFKFLNRKDAQIAWIIFYLLLFTTGCKWALTGISPVPGISVAIVSVSESGCEWICSWFFSPFGFSPLCLWPRPAIRSGTADSCSTLCFLPFLPFESSKRWCSRSFLGPGLPWASPLCSWSFPWDSVLLICPWLWFSVLFDSALPLSVVSTWSIWVSFPTCLAFLWWAWSTFCFGEWCLFALVTSFCLPCPASAVYITNLKCFYLNFSLVERIWKNIHLFPRKYKLLWLILSFSVVYFCNCASKRNKFQNVFFILNFIQIYLYGSIQFKHIRGHLCY